MAILLAILEQIHHKSSTEVRNVPWSYLKHLYLQYFDVLELFATKFYFTTEELQIQINILLLVGLGFIKCKNGKGFKCRNKVSCKKSTASVNPWNFWSKLKIEKCKNKIELRI